MRAVIEAVRNWLAFNPIAWLRDAKRVRRLLQTASGLPPRRDASVRFLVVVTPWLGTAVPWFSLACGLLLGSSRSNVAFVIDDLPFGGKGIRRRFVLACIRSVTSMLRTRSEVYELSRFAISRTLLAFEQATVDRLARLNATWLLRGETTDAGRARYIGLVAHQLTDAYAAIASFVSRSRYDAVLLPGGVYGSSGIWAECAQRGGMRVASYDSSTYGAILLATSGIACQLQDIPRAFSMLTGNAQPGERAFMIAEAQEEIARRRAGADKFASQLIATSAPQPRFESAILIALNSSWDSAALGLHGIFDSSSEWVLQTVANLLETTDKPVVVRQHPVERLDVARSSDDYATLLRKRFGDHERLHFIAAGDPVNSYELLKQVSAVVVHTSTFGIEAAAHGKAVLTQSHSYYSQLGFVSKATSLAHYQELLLSAANGRIAVTPQMREDALCCYYLTQCCNWLFTPFNPDGFVEWIDRSLPELMKVDSVRMMLAALEQGTPVALLNHQARLGRKQQ